MLIFVFSSTGSTSPMSTADIYRRGYAGDTMCRVPWWDQSIRPSPPRVFFRRKRSAGISPSDSSCRSEERPSEATVLLLGPVTAPSTYGAAWGRSNVLDLRAVAVLLPELKIYRASGVLHRDLIARQYSLRRLWPKELWSFHVHQASAKPRCPLGASRRALCPSSLRALVDDICRQRRRLSAVVKRSPW